jgi:hypothetical protein
MIDEINEYLFTSRYSEEEFNIPAIGFSLNDFVSHNYMKNTGSMYIFGLGFVIFGVIYFSLKNSVKRLSSGNFHKQFKSKNNLNSGLIRLAK